MKMAFGLVLSLGCFCWACNRDGSESLGKDAACLDGAEQADVTSAMDLGDLVDAVEISDVPPLAKEEAIRLGITSNPSGLFYAVLEDPLPSRFKPRIDACALGGYDLRRCAGQAVTYTSFAAADYHYGCYMDVSIMTTDTTSCCAYETSTPGQPSSCGGSPGVSPVGRY